MKWLQWNPGRAGAMRLISIVVLVVAAFATVMIYVPNLQQRRASAGFTPDWECAVQPKGDPICIRKTAR